MSFAAWPSELTKQIIQKIPRKLVFHASVHSFGFSQVVLLKREQAARMCYVKQDLNCTWAKPAVSLIGIILHLMMLMKYLCQSHCNKIVIICDFLDI